MHVARADRYKPALPVSAPAGSSHVRTDTTLTSLTADRRPSTAATSPCPSNECLRWVVSLAAVLFRATSCKTSRLRRADRRYPLVPGRSPRSQHKAVTSLPDPTSTCRQTRARRLATCAVSDRAFTSPARACKVNVPDGRPELEDRTRQSAPVYTAVHSHLHHAGNEIY
ncbi:hypothetical protein OH76DRAFT_1562396 [Lentinus brumalis]|uniref:Uncharacterized protein n=1 Tax=Lentinus brumalis TaxID=2498619 RepID=A0A371CGR5_9APHY|nr:hypothetical protein OH76DRAFT_1562396 [Polyporus brumalis]